MALKNVNTGQTVSDMQKSANQDTLIGLQATEIFTLQTRISEMAAQMKSQEEETAKLRADTAKIPAQQETIENLKAKLNAAEREKDNAITRAMNAENELKAERENREKEKKDAYKLCYRCHRNDYIDMLAKVYKRNRELNEEEITVKRRTEMLNKMYKEFDAEVDRRVARIVKKKTRAERFITFANAVRAKVDTELTLGAIAYSFIVTFITFFRYDALKNDIVSAAAAVKGFLVNNFMIIKSLIVSAADITSRIESAIAGKILWWVIVIALILAALLVIVLICAGMGKLAKLILEKNSEKFDETLAAVVLFDFIAVVFAGDFIKNILPINLCLTFNLVIAAYFFLRFGLPVIIPAIIEGIEDFVRQL